MLLGVEVRPEKHDLGLHPHPPAAPHHHVWTLRLSTLYDMTLLQPAPSSCRAVRHLISSPTRLPTVAAVCRSSSQRCRRSSACHAIPSAQELLGLVSTPHPGLAAGVGVNAAVFTFGLPVLLKGLTTAGVINAFALGTVVFAAFGAKGYLLVVLYFIFGTLVTKLKLEQKQKEGIAEARSGRRGPNSVWGSGSAGAACAALALLTGDFALWQVGFIASFTSKLSDTVSSEVGKAYGQTTYLITTLARVPRGTEGAVSLEGTVAGIVAAAVFAAVAFATGQVDATDAAIVAAAAVVANIAESYIGAVVQGRIEWLTNDLVNVIQISIAAALAVVAKYALTSGL